LWRPGLVSLHLISDSIIALSYYSIPIGLVWLIRRRRDLPFNWMFWMFAIFIAGCGTTHLMEIWTLWHPSYWAAGTIKAVTAVASIGTAVAMVPLLPRAAALPTPRQLEQANLELAKANRELEGFAYSVSHDLRAPLRAIDGFSQALIEDHGPTLKPEAQRLLAVVRENSQRMGTLIDDLLAFSRLARQPLTLAPLDMERLARAVVDQLGQEDTSRARTTIGELPRALGDLALIRQVLVNLIQNAFKFSRGRSEPQVEVSGRRERGEVVYTVRDNGVGFDMRYAGKLFGVFQRLHPIEQFEGTGVGLALVERIVVRHGGRVWGEGEVDRGAAFSFTLPDPEAA
jgi:light-regulated signal transduction histidine kinase (bacteriophytochrome)